MIIGKKGVNNMAVSYKKLWHLLLDKNMKKKDLKEAAKLTGFAMDKLNKNEPIMTDVLGRICTALDCKVEDIMEFIPDNVEEDK